MFKKSDQLLKSAGLISLATIISRILGLIREQILLALFTRFQTDAFNVAFRIPNLLRDLFAEGAMSAAFVPTFTQTLERDGNRSAWRLGSLIINFLLVLLGFIVLIGLLNAPWIVHKIAGSFASQAGKFDLTVLLTQIMFPFLVLVALAAVVMGMLNSHGRFFIPALSPALFNVGSILATLFLFSLLPRYSFNPVIGMAVGTIIGGLMQLTIQLLPLFRLGFRYSLNFSFNNSGLRQILILMGPGTLGLAATQINLFVNTWLATSQGEGPVTWLNAAFRLMYFPIGILGVSIASAALPTFSSLAAHHQNDTLCDTISSSLRLSILLNVPASLGLICLSHPIVSLIYERGHFTKIDTWETGWVLIYYSLGLSAYSAIKLLVPVFYALKQPRIPVTISTITVTLAILFNLLLINQIGYRGLALITSLAAFLNFFLLYYWLQKISVRLHSEIIGTTFLKVFAASVVMAISTFYFHQWLIFRLPQQTLPWSLFGILTSVLLGLWIFFLGCILLKVGELDEAMKWIRRKLRPEEAASS